MNPILVVLLSHVITLSTICNGSEEERCDEMGRLFGAWQRRTKRVETVAAKLEWEVGEYGRFSRFQNEWLPTKAGNPTRMTSSLSIQGEQVRFDGLAWTYDEHLMGMPVFDYQRHVGDYSEMMERLTTERYRRSLYSHFTRTDLERRDPQLLLSVFDGDRRSNLWTGGGVRYAREILLPKPIATSYRRAYRAAYFQACHDGAFDLDSLQYQPIMLCYRPFELSFGGIDTSLCSLDGETIIDGHRCLKLHERSEVNGDELHRWFFVDPSRDWVVTRYIGVPHSMPQVQIDVEYIQLAEGEWTPLRWDVMRVDFSDRPIQMFASFKATEYQINHSGVDANYEITRPPGTWTVEWDIMRQWVTKPDGSKRMITELESDVAASYDALINSKPGQTYFEEQRSAQPIVLRCACRWESASLLGVLCCIAGLYPWKTKS